MTTQDIIRAWKDETYRASLSPEQLVLLPENPAGLSELSNEELEQVSGGYPIPPHNSHASTCLAHHGCQGIESYLILCGI